MHRIEINEADWKLYRSRIADWQEDYMERLCKEYIELLSSDQNASDRFWAVFDKRASLKTPFEKKQLCTTSTASTSLGVRQHACGRLPCSCRTYPLFL